MITTDLSIIIPAYNEEKVILSTVNDIVSTLNKNRKKCNYEIIVIDDGSIDNTAKLIKDIQINNVKLIQFLKNKGKGAAVKKGMLSANGEFCLYTDADNATPVNNLLHFEKYINSYDVIIGSRVLPESTIIKKQPLYRIIIGRVGNFLIRKILKINYFDTQCGFKLFTKKAVKKVFPKVHSSGWAFDFEVLKIAEEYGFKIKELPVTWKNNPDSKIKLVDYLKILKDLFFVWKRH